MRLEGEPQIWWAVTSSTRLLFLFCKGVLMRPTSRLVTPGGRVRPSRSLRVTRLSDRQCGSETRRSVCRVPARQVLDLAAQRPLPLAPLELLTHHLVWPSTYLARPQASGGGARTAWCPPWAHVRAGGGVGMVADGGGVLMVAGATGQCACRRVQGGEPQEAAGSLPGLWREWTEGWRQAGVISTRYGAPTPCPGSCG